MKYFFGLFSALVSFFLFSNIVQGQSLHYESPVFPWSVELGVGPSFLVADNSFLSGETTFRPMLGITASLSKNYSDRFSIRGTMGYQKVLGRSMLPREELVELGTQNQAFSVYGNAFYVDIAPVIKYARRTYYESRTHINLYSSVGVGAMMLLADHAVMLPDQIAVNEYNNLFLIIPLRTGITYRFHPLWETSLEGTFMVTFNDDIDGRSIDNNLNDYFGIIQLKIRKTFSIYGY